MYARTTLPRTVTRACAQLGVIVYLKWEHTRKLVLVVFMLKSTKSPGHFQANITMLAPHQTKHHTTNPPKYPPVNGNVPEGCSNQPYCLQS